MEKNRILELALEELQRQKAEIDEEIETLRKELKGTRSAVGQTESTPSAGTRRGRQRTAAQRKAQAQKMREIWAARKAQAAKGKEAVKKPAPANANLRTKTAAQKKAISVAMKKAWQRRKAAAAEKAGKA